MCRDPKYTHPDSDINDRLPIRSKEELKDYKYHIELDPKVKPIVCQPRK